MATPEVLAAVSAAVKGEDPPAPVVVDPPAGDPPDDPPADPPAAAAADLIGDPPPAPAAPAAAEPVVDAQGRVRGPDGKFAAAPAAAAAPSTPVAAAAAAAAAAAPATPPAPLDPVNDPIPANARPDTRERITTLADMVKTTTAELETTRGDLELLTSQIAEAGATLEQFQESMGLVRLLNSPHQHEQAQALQILQATAAQLADRLGHVPPGTDPLAGQPDLLQHLAANPASRPMLEEVAKARRLTAATAQHQQAEQRRTQQQSTHQQAVQQGQQAVASVEQTLKASDPQYAAKVSVLRADTAFMNKMRTSPPAQWAVMFAEKYRTVQVAAPRPAAAAAPAAAAPGAPTPLRAKTPAGSAGKPPTSQGEAIRAGLAQLAAR